MKTKNETEQKVGVSARTGVSRQYRLQCKWRNLGRCIICGKPATHSNSFCDYHLEWKRNYMRKRRGYKPKVDGGRGRCPNTPNRELNHER